MGACKSKKQSTVAPQPPKEPPQEQPAAEPPAQALNDPPPPAQAPELAVAERAPEDPPAAAASAHADMAATSLETRKFGLAAFEDFWPFPCDGLALCDTIAS